MFGPEDDLNSCKVHLESWDSKWHDNVYLYGYMSAKCLEGDCDWNVAGWCMKGV